jgi:hypothetical protein
MEESRLVLPTIPTRIGRSQLAISSVARVQNTTLSLAILDCQAVSVVQAHFCLFVEI